jgi:hypothetical protein
MAFPEVPLKLGVGPWTETEFYQDFDFGGVKVSEKDFGTIEKYARDEIVRTYKVFELWNNYKRGKNNGEQIVIDIETTYDKSKIPDEASLYKTYKDKMSKTISKEATIQKLAQGYIKELKSLIAHCVLQEKGQRYGRDDG